MESVVKMVYNIKKTNKTDDGPLIVCVNDFVESESRIVQLRRRLNRDYCALTGIIVCLVVLLSTFGTLYFYRSSFFDCQVSSIS